MAKIACGRTRPSDRPYEVWVAGDWTWKVLKKYQKDDDAPFARAFCLVETPYTGSQGDLGDTYIAEYKKYGTLVSTDYDKD